MSEMQERTHSHYSLGRLFLLICLAFLAIVARGDAVSFNRKHLSHNASEFTSEKQQQEVDAQNDAQYLAEMFQRSFFRDAASDRSTKPEPFASDNNKKKYYIIGGVVVIVIILIVIIICCCCFKKNKEKKKNKQGERTDTQQISEKGDDSTSSQIVEQLPLPPPYTQKDDNESTNSLPRTNIVIAEINSSESHNEPLTTGHSDAKLSEQDNYPTHSAAEGAIDNRRPSSPRKLDAAIEPHSHIKRTDSEPIEKANDSHLLERESSSKGDGTVVKDSEKPRETGRKDTNLNALQPNYEKITGQMVQAEKVDQSTDQNISDGKPHDYPPVLYPRVDLRDKKPLNEPVSSEFDRHHLERGKDYNIRVPEDDKNRMVADSAIRRYSGYISRDYTHSRRIEDAREYDYDAKTDYDRLHRHELSRVSHREYTERELNALRYHSEDIERRNLPDPGHYDQYGKRRSSWYGETGRPHRSLQNYPSSGLTYEDIDRQRGYNSPPVDRDSRYIIPYSTDVRRELSAVVAHPKFPKRYQETQPDMRHSYYDVPHSTASSRLDFEGKRTSQHEKYSSTYERKRIIKEEELPNISIPEPDYQVVNKENLPEHVLGQQPPPVPPKHIPNTRSPTSVIKPREFKGPYGPEDLDEMNNPYF